MVLQPLHSMIDLHLRHREIHLRPSHHPNLSYRRHLPVQAPSRTPGLCNCAQQRQQTACQRLRGQQRISTADESKHSCPGRQIQCPLVWGPSCGCSTVKVISDVVQGKVGDTLPGKR